MKLAFAPERSLYFMGGIDTQTSMDLITGMTRLYASDPAGPITLFINSTGGSVKDSFAIYEYVMKVLKPNLQTVALGEVNSMAILLFTMGERRYVGRLAAMRFHKLSRGFTQEANLTDEEAAKTHQDLAERNQEYADLIVSRSNHRVDRAAMIKIMKDGSVVRARQAVNIGLAHKML